MAVKDLLINILADDKTGQAFDKVGGKAKSMSSTLSTASSAVLLAAAGGAVAAVNAGMVVDGVYDTIAQGTGATGQVLEGLQDSFAAVARQVPADMADIGDSMSTLYARTGLTGGQLERMTAQVVRLGSFAGQGAIDVDALTGATTLFGVPADKMSSALDELYGVSQKTGVPVNELTATIGKNGAQLLQLGFGLTESAALLGTLDKAGIDSTKVSAAMGAGLVKLAKAGEEPQEAFRRVVGEIGGFLKAGDQAGALDLAATVFGTKGASQFVTAVQSGALNLEAITAAAVDSGASILEMGETTDDFPEKWARFQNTAQLALAQVGEKLIPIITEGFEKLLPMIDWMTDNTDLVLGFAGALVAVAAGVKGFEIFNTVQGALTTFRGAQALGTAVTTANTGATVANNLAWLASPVTWIVLGIVAAVAGLVAAGIWLVQNWDGVSKFLGDVARNFSIGFAVAVDFVSDLFLNWTPLGHIIKNWGAISEWFTGWWDGVLGGVDRAVGWIGGKVDGFVGFFTAIPNRVGAAWTGLIGIVRDVMYQVTSFAVDAWNNTLGGLSLDLPWFLGGAHIEFPKLSMPALAAGGIVTGPTVALIGEAGDEMVVPLDRASEFGFGGGGDTYHETVITLDGKVLARELRKINGREDF